MPDALVVRAGAMGLGLSRGGSLAAGAWRLVVYVFTLDCSSRAGALHVRCRADPTGGVFTTDGFFLGRRLHLSRMHMH